MKKRDDDLLRALGAVARERDREAEAEAEGGAAGGNLPERPDLALDRSARERIVDHLVANLGRTSSPSAHPALRVRWGGRAALAAGALALAAAALLLLRRRPPADDLPADVPAYAFLASGESAERAPAPATTGPCLLRAADGGGFELVARPEDVVVGGVAARVYLARRGGLDVAPFAIEVSSQGAARIAGPRAGLAGASELVLVIGRPEALPPASLVGKTDRPSGGPGWRALRCAIAPTPPTTR